MDVADDDEDVNFSINIVPRLNLSNVVVLDDSQNEQQQQQQRSSTPHLQVLWILYMYRKRINYL